MSRSVIIFGKNSFLARGAIDAFQDCKLILLEHREIEDIGFCESNSVVINFTCHPALENRPLKNQELTEFELVNIIRKTNFHVVQLSTRRVYGKFNCPVTEESELDPQSIGGYNKLKSEKLLQANIPPDRLTILRLGNIFGLENDIHRRTFFARALTSLAFDGRINLDIDPRSEKDFLPLHFFARAVDDIARIRPSGTFNLGAGFSTSVGDICSWLINGFGRGKLNISQGVLTDSFWLDCSKIDKHITAKIRRPELQSSVREIGRSLVYEKS
ncbi:sugar nucleotide-binding protein (plasmid) [Roseibium aggregatum]|uniref:NAD-dependent epimerase/dehydratase family protein n=1 Tax=Roseibium aggregatum TaxID=187304 RepID=UPI001E3640C0|nr:NAD-dependent epimerase/dehydratase family protein [Roseibium aggregatum]UES60270.1 sugar nucleotide-binding protein [Roseibium aggregatum]